MSYDFLDGPLPPAEPGMRMATPDLFEHLQPDSFKPLKGTALDVRETIINKLSGGSIGVSVYRARPGAESRGIPWHWHELGVHIAYVTKGWAVFEFEGVGKVRVEAGSFMYQLPFNRHRELDQSSDFEALEFTLPGEFKTVVLNYNGDEWSKTEIATT